MARTGDEPRFAIVEARRDASLNEQVWKHAAWAQEQGLCPVVELYAKSQRLSRALHKFWRRGDQEVSDTLAGIALFRVNVPLFGPEPVIRLSPYAVFGLPLFIGWNRRGQLLTRGGFTSAQREDLLLALSAYFDDVVHDRPHHLAGSPRLPGVSAPPTAHVAKTPDPTEVSSSNEASPSSETSPPNETSPSSEASLVSEAPRPQDDPSSPTARPTSPEEPAPQQDTSFPTTKPGAAAVRDLEHRLEPFLVHALEAAQAFLEERGLPADGSLHSLQQLDAYLDDPANGATTPDFARRYLVPVGVYFGWVVVSGGQAEWGIDRSQQSPVEALTLCVRTPSGEELYRPLSLTLERISDPSKGLYGHAISMCRIL